MEEENIQVVTNSAPPAILATQAKTTASEEYFTIWR